MLLIDAALVGARVDRTGQPTPMAHTESWDWNNFEGGKNRPFFPHIIHKPAPNLDQMLYFSSLVSPPPALFASHLYALQRINVSGSLLVYLSREDPTSMQSHNEEGSVEEESINGEEHFNHTFSAPGEERQNKFNLESIHSLPLPDLNSSNSIHPEQRR